MNARRAVTRRPVSSSYRSVSTCSARPTGMIAALYGVGMRGEALEEKVSSVMREVAK